MEKLSDASASAPLARDGAEGTGVACVSSDSATPALEFAEFSFRYPASDDNPDPAGIGPVSWTVERGAFVMLMGATGCGKTTLMRCAKPELAPTGDRSGSIFIGGVNVRDLTTQQSACSVGYVAQNPDNQIVCDTVWHEMAFGLENIATPPDEMRRRVAEVAHFFGIEPWFRKQVSDLSGGQRQMLNLASVLAMQPSLLLLDEPTSQLDPVAEKNFCHALFRLNRELGLTVVVATHMPESFAPYATQAVRLENGQVSPIDVGQFVRLASTANMQAWPRVDAAAVQPQGTAVKVEDLHVRYSRDDEFVLRGTDLLVERGTIHAIVGGNGSGKSTLLKATAGMLKCERGKVKNMLQARQAFLPQNPKSLFACDSVMDELREWQKPCGYDDAAVRDALAACGLENRSTVHPYDLSGGQQQLLALYKLMLTDPDLLLLDEPTKGLDPASRYAVARTLIQFARSGKTIILATHDLAFTASVADSASMVFDGQVTCTEPAQTFFTRNLFYRPAPDAFTAYIVKKSSEA